MEGTLSLHLLSLADFCLFQDIDKFGNEITQLARPLPVEYLIIDVSTPLYSNLTGWYHSPHEGQDS